MSAFLAFSRVRSITQKLVDGLQPYVAQTQTISRRCVAYHFEVKRSKVKVTAAFGSWMNMQFIAIFSCPLCSSARISWINLISGTNTNHEWMMCRVTFPGQKVKGQGHRGHRKFGACPLCSSVLISWIYIICGTNTNHEWTMCHVTFPGQKVKGQGYRGHQNFRACALSKHWFRIQNWLGSAAINCLSVALVILSYLGSTIILMNLRISSAVYAMEMVQIIFSSRCNALLGL